MKYIIMPKPYVIEADDYISASKIGTKLVDGEFDVYQEED